MTLAQGEAEAGHHSYIGAEHLLLGLLLVEDGLAHRALTSLGFHEPQLRASISRLQASSKPIPIQQIIPTSNVKQVIEHSFEIAAGEHSPAVDTGHMLIALGSVEDAIASPVLAEHEATPERISSAVEGLRRDGLADTMKHETGGRPKRQYLYVPDANGVRIGIDILFPADYSEQQRSELAKRVRQAIRGGS